MRVVIKQGNAGLWYGTAEEVVGLYRGLLIVGPTMDSVIDKIPDAFKDLRDAASAALAQHAEGNA